MIRQGGVAERTQTGRAPRWAGERRVRVRLLGLASLVVIAVVVSVAVGLPGRVFRPPPRPIATIAVGASPAGVAVDPAAHRAYVANSDDGALSVIDTRLNAVVATVRVGADPVGVAVDPAAHHAYVTNGSGAVSVLDTTRNAVVATLDANSFPAGIALDPAAHRAYVAVPRLALVRVLDTHSNAYVGAIHMGALKDLSTNAAGLALDPAAHRVYVAVLGMPKPGSPVNKVAVLDTDAALVVGAIPVGGTPTSVAVDPAAHRAYVTNSNDGTVSVLDTGSNTVVATVQVGSVPIGVAVDPAAHRVYVANHSDGTVSVLEGGA